jgi:hypothetical protein
MDHWGAHNHGLLRVRGESRTLARVLGSGCKMRKEGWKKMRKKPGGAPGGEAG